MPLWAYFANDKSDRGPHLFDGFPALTEYTHWRPAKDDIPEPPLAQPEQEEADLAALVQWGRDENIQPLFTVRKTWHAALAYEREQVAKMLPVPQGAFGPAYQDYCTRAIELIRARCEGGGK